VLLVVAFLGVVFASCPGCSSYLHVTDTEARKAADFASKQINRGRLVSDLSLLEASVQIVAGKNFFLTFSGTFNGSEAVADVIVYQDLQNHLSLTEFKLIRNLMGGYEKIDPTSSELSAVAEFGWKHIASREADLRINIKKNSRILTAARQIVNGYNYKLLLDGDFNDVHAYAFVTIYKPREGSMRAISYEVTRAEIPTLILGNSRSSAGGLTKVSPSRPDVVQAAKFAVNYLNEAAVDDLEVLSARVQIVSGTNYFLSLRATIRGEKSMMEVIVYKTLQKEFSVVRVNVLEEGGDCAGCARKITTEDEGVQEAARWAWVYLARQVDGIDMENGEMEIYDASVQVVAGLNYYLSIHGSFAHKDIVAHVTIFKNLSGDYELINYNLENDS